MAITQQKAESVVLLSALVVGGGYLYRRVSEGEPTQTGKGNTALRVLGQGETLPTGKFVTGFGISFVVISMLASLEPQLGASFAGLLAAGSFFFNGQAITQDVRKGLKGGHPLAQLKEGAAPGSSFSELQPIEGIEAPNLTNLNKPPALQRGTPTINTPANLGGLREASGLNTLLGR